MTNRRTESDDAPPRVKTLLIRVFWGQRQESKGSCADRLASCLSQLGAVSPLFEAWKALGRSRSEARSEIETTARALARHLRQHYTDVPRAPIPSLGFRFGAWAGEFEGPSANISVHCGSYNPRSSNSAVLSIACYGTWGQVGRSTVRSLLDVLVETWRPEWGTAGFGLFHALPPEPQLDWMVYLDARRRPPSFAEPTNVETLPEGRGSMITLAPEPPDLRSAGDAMLVENVRQGLLA
jgi:hypothetical protein